MEIKELSRYLEARMTSNINRSSSFASMNIRKLWRLFGQVLKVRERKQPMFFRRLDYTVNGSARRRSPSSIRKKPVFPSDHK